MLVDMNSKTSVRDGGPLHRHHFDSLMADDDFHPAPDFVEFLRGRAAAPRDRPRPRNPSSAGSDFDLGALEA